MNETVVQFPKPNQRSWPDWELCSRRLLEQISIDDDGRVQLDHDDIERIIADLRPRYLSLIARSQRRLTQYNLNDPEQVRIVESFKEGEQLLGMELLYQLLTLEVDLYFARSRREFTAPAGPASRWLKLAQTPNPVDD